MAVRARGALLGVVLALAVTGCGYYYYAGPLRPLADQREAMAVADDGSVTFTRDRLEIRLKPMQDEELNRLFASHSAAGMQSTNPYTFGNGTFWEEPRQRARFTVFRLSAKNYSYPKVKIDPTRILLKADNRREYWSLSLQQLDTYYRAYALGYRGNEYARYQERMDLLRRTMLKSDEIFSGQEVEGFVVFPALHPDVRQVRVIVRDVVLRFDFRNEPVEAIALEYGFDRDTGRKYQDGRLVLKPVR
jgi:hypothetical protein